MTEHLKVSVDNGVMEITWNRPDKKNAITNAMYAAAGDALERASADKSIRVALLTSEGDSFTAGNDLSVFAAANAGTQAEAPQGHRLIHNLAKFDKPLVAGVRGVAIGVGTTMLLHCDLVYVAKDAKLSTPFVNLALVPEAASSITLPARVGHARAFAMFALGEPLTGEQAASWSASPMPPLPADEVIGAARDGARKLAQRPLGALMATKKLMRDGEILLAADASRGRDVRRAAEDRRSRGGVRRLRADAPAGFQQGLGASSAAPSTVRRFAQGEPGDVSFGRPARLHLQLHLHRPARGEAAAAERQSRGLSAVQDMAGIVRLVWDPGDNFPIDFPQSFGIALELPRSVPENMRGSSGYGANSRITSSPTVMSSRLRSPPPRATAARHRG